MGRITLSDICKSFGAVHVLHGIDLDIAEGELVVFVGPSGCGKSTLLRLIAGLEKPTSGKIEINGNDVTRVNAADRGLAMVFQSYALYPHMSVRQNMAFGLENAHLPKSEIADRIAEASRMLEIGDYLDRRPGQLSGGQRQRVAIGRAIVRNPTAFLLDEPLSNLDAELRVSMRAELASLHARLKTTMIYVTHDQIEAMTLADRIVVLRKGRIEQVDTPLNLFNRPANLFVAGFIGAPAMNFIAARSDGAGNGGTAFRYLDDGRVELPVTEPLSNGAGATLGIRPQHLRLAGNSDPASFHATVTLVEALGAETVVHTQVAGGEKMLAVLPGQAELERGETIALTFDPANLHAFGENGMRLAGI
ncbi:sn-glycerol-3-phosphate ABC transporter ATP-binding protein UgpC [Stappia sp. F7233]|uniref:sn-glycerol-3-phosphate ABC transporter ATP-binding protein UgpC n=1 Tax=Stappia albiluteola TaxID=2758565 RepID=A0A839AH68_9HYPH|nr:sn-glycerol-3-phosphate ABC transporter ATP-binding protein UgpC [Stappia albiluteola]MBA5778252.1 sn-glycerol-3-phosphate ABC transporter ATP-binding protein UgpC [Stappia albiluteola]